MNPSTMTPLSPSNSGVAFLIHGTRNTQAQAVILPALADLCDRFAQTVGLPRSSVAYCFLEAIDPLLETALDQFCVQGLTQLHIMPLLLFPGTHLFLDVPEVADKVRAAHPGVTIHVSPHLGVDESEFMGILLKRLSQTPATLQAAV